MSRLEGDVLRELEDGLCLLVYDIPYPPDKSKAWLSWYDWSTRRLKSMGYSIQYSVVVIPESRISAVLEIVNRINDKRMRLNKGFGLNIPEPRINIIRFNLKTRKDVESMASIIINGLKNTIEVFVKDIEEQIRNGKDKTRLQQRVKKFIENIKRKDFLNLLIIDPDLRKLIIELEILLS
ncbi:MAG TPA: hypothetical protein ENF42_00435 [Candidatus Bathyarchaeota archaeon]|nr:hypothetical protein [Candidatus Bathyarchaeota archaeon]